MVISEHFPELANWNIRILGTDLSDAVLTRAKAGAFKQLEVNRGMPAALLLKYFERRGTEWLVNPEIKNRVEFRRMNLIEPWPPLPRFDIVFLRNVLIYFDLETKRDLLDRTYRTLDPEGFMFLGGAETTINVDDRFQRAFVQSAGCYRLK
jgi:chemotaxis protein methyltransferase CheR